MITPQTSGQPSPPPCEHKAVMKDLCVDCGIDIRNLSEEERRNILSEATVSMVHSVPELKVRVDVAEKLGQTEQDSLLKARKLVLLVDLDQTIIHTTNDPKDVPKLDKGEEPHSFHLYPPGHPLYSNHPSNMYHTKLRPHTKEFLEKVSEKYQLHICTFGSRMYAHTIAGIIDPDKKLFEDRILSRDECLDPTSKTGNLKSLFPVGDKIVAIIDDREDVWNFTSNVIAVKPYHYFKNTGDINNPFKGREREGKSGTSSLLGMEADIKNLADQEPSDAVVLVEPSLSQPQPEPLTVDPDASESDQSSSPEVLPSQDSLSVPTAAIERLSAPSTPSSQPSTPTSPPTEDTPSESVPSTPTGPSTPASTESDSPPKRQVDTLETLSTDSSSTDGASVNTEKSKEEKMEESTPVVKEPEEPMAVTEPDPSVDDQDDYLLYLEDILTRIHEEYFKEYDEKNKHTVDDEIKIVPDLKEIIPHYRRQTLTNVSIVFSGIVPTNVPQERHRMYQVAKLLGAKVTKDVMIESDGASPYELTTHVVGAKYWTDKIKKAIGYNKAVKAKKGRRKIHIVNPLWLTTCFERWERVDERIFLLQTSDDFQLKDNVTSARLLSKAASSRQGSQDPRTAASSAATSNVTECPVYDPVTGKRVKRPDPPEAARSSKSKSDLEEQFMFSQFDIKSMGKEVDDACSEGSEDFSDDDDSQDAKTDKVRKRVLDGTDSEDSNFAGLDADAPKGWKKLKSSHVPCREMEEESTNDGPVPMLESSSSDSEDDDDESLDEDAALIEKQFLND